VNDELTILVADDDDEDAALLQQAFSAAGWPGELLRARDGLELLASLARFGPERRLLVLLDLRMPLMGGLDALRKLKADASLSSVPVVVLTTSGSDRDAAGAYAAGAAGYLRKPARFDDYVRLASRLVGYWSACSLVPAGGETAWTASTF
jgi:CheY-like chemotaxis protein